MAAAASGEGHAQYRPDVDEMPRRTEHLNYASNSADSDNSEELSIYRMLNPVLRHRRLVALVPTILLVVVVSISLLLHRTYTTTVSFMPSVQNSPLGQAAGLAAKFGVSLPGQDPTQSPDFYADLLGTSEFLKKIALSEYTLANNQHGNLIDLLEITGSSQKDQLYKALKKLTSGIISVDADEQTDVVNITVRSKWPELSQQIAKNILDQVNEFNVANRQYQGEQERRFMQSRLDQSAAELRSSENDLQAFLEHNRDFKSDPQLSFQFDRLQRAVNMRQDVYTTLMQSVEQARIDAARNTPAIVVIEHPAPALRPDRRGLLTKGILAIIGGFFLGVFIVLARAFASTELSTMPPAEEFAELRVQTVNDLRRLGRPFRSSRIA